MFSEKFKNGRWQGLCAIAILSALMFIPSGCGGSIDEKNIESNKIGSGDVFSTDDSETTLGEKDSTKETTTVQPETTEPPTEPPTTTQSPTTTSPPTQPPTTTQPPTEPPTEPPTTTAAPVQPAPIKISTPAASGTAVASQNGYIVDYSNASQGYIMVKGSDSYSGTLAIQVFKDNTDGTPLAQYVAVNAGGYTTFSLTAGSGKYVVRVMEQREGGYSPKLTAEFNAAISSETAPYIYPSYVVKFSSSSLVVNNASNVCAGCTTDEQKVLAVKKYIIDTLEYDKSKKEDVENGKLKFYVPNADSVLTAGKGICYDYASLFAAMLRCQGIPVRLVKGYAYSVSEGKMIYHAWNEAYYNGSWHFFDCTFEDGGTISSSYTVTSYD